MDGRRTVVAMLERALSSEGLGGAVGGDGVNDGSLLPVGVDEGPE